MKYSLVKNLGLQLGRKKGGFGLSWPHGNSIWDQFLIFWMFRLILVEL